MKRIFIIANIVLAAAVVALYVLYFTGNCTKKSAIPVHGEAAADIPAGSIVYVQIDSLINQLDLFHALRSEFETRFKKINDDLTKQARAFERDALDFQDKANKGLLLRSQIETQQAQLENRQRELQQFSQQKEMELAEEEQVLLNNVLNEIKVFLTAYNIEHNFSLIFTTSGVPGNIIIGNSALDITKDVVAGLNAKYIAQYGKKK